MRTSVILAGLALVLFTTLGLVLQKEHVLATGQLVLLELAPRDPRSLMQGDYMELDYAIARERGWVDTGHPAESPSRDGHFVLKLDEHGVGQYVRIDTPDLPLAPGEFKLRYRLRGGWARLGAESFFFQEGHGPRFARARYAELRVTSSGTSVLVGLRDANRQPIPAEGDEPPPGLVDPPFDPAATATEPPPEEAPSVTAPTVAPEAQVAPPAPGGPTNAAADTDTAAQGDPTTPPPALGAPSP
ncbi:GDYXXLXY domain-containing protein [Myxococcus sp. K15C18031901]|uniref:GDYXXLXY domain-containing protein n=1 Tax=Myxococcus dinghuensis TaxID=2906761 RepID=UPI0020A7AC67|nr:GDYXXLXY domain-containing protein [Myxococcus dinghuensis]MCP3103289.1 GDYXXLXY domain-containing protein [Myxococcus dinghuensis]